MFRTFLLSTGKLLQDTVYQHQEVQRDSKRWTQFRTSIFPELYMVCE